MSANTYATAQLGLFLVVLLITLLIGTVILIGALTYIPALALGPIAEHLHRTAAVGSVMPSVYVDAHGQISAM
jgi:hypothetical protein